MRYYYPIADTDDYQYDYSESDQENLENEETESDITFQIVSRPETFTQKIGQKVMLPCKVVPEGK